MPREVVCWTLRKLGTKQWLVKIVQSMYKNVRSCVRWFPGPGKLLLLTIMLEALYREIRAGCLEELFHDDDLALVSETLKGLWLTIQVLEGALESKRLEQILKSRK